MAIRSITDVQQANAAAAAKSNDPSANLNSSQFLKLLVTQMQYQDPLSPMDSAQFTAQLAQFSSLEQLVQVNSNLTGLTQSQTPSGMASVAGFIGRDVLATGDTTAVASGTATPLQFYLDGPAEVVNVLVQGSNGSTVRNLSLGRLPGGDQQIAWDGMDANGAPLPDGTYSFSVTAQDVAGSSVGARTQVQGTVTGAVFQGGQAQLVVGTRRIPLADVLAVKDPAPAGG
jgi:flagellar basal-body rod modification protein FlgD